MNKCVICNNEEAIYSGVDAWVLGVPVEKVGYSCANIYNQINGLNEKVGA